MGYGVLAIDESSDTAILEEGRRGVSFGSLALVEDCLYLHAAFVDTDQGLGYGRRRERVRLDEDLRLRLVNLTDDGVRGAALRAEIDLDRRVLGEGEVGSMPRLKGNKESKENWGSEGNSSFHNPHESIKQVLIKYEAVSLVLNIQNKVALNPLMLTEYQVR